MPPQVEPRPRLHVTPPAGWLNDPVGGLVHHGRAHLFFQHVPGSTGWRPDCHWGHLAGEDLVRWRHQPVALAPGDGDDGVWSGSAVVDGRGPVLVYTSVRTDRLDLGRVALARPVDDDLVGWRKHGGPVLEPPAGLGVTHFRDPYVWGRPGDWSMVVGAGLADRGGAVLRFTGPDLATWRFRGVLAAGGDGLGQVWECPQYVDLDGRPALVVSVWDGGVLTRVAAATGTARDGTFVPDGWATLGHGGSAYALSTYRDRAGRLAGTAWLRHDDPPTPRAGWSGMLSLPVLLTAGAGGGVHVAPHPDVDTLRLAPLPVTGGTVRLPGGVGEVLATLPPGAELRLDTAAGEPVRLAATAAGLVARSAAGPTGGPADGSVRVPGAAPVRLRVVVDRGAVEAWTGDGRWLALRLPHLHVTGAVATGATDLAAWHLDPVQAEPSTPLSR